MKIFVFIITALIQLAAAACGFFMLLLGLNGFSESQAAPGIIFYIIFGIASAAGVGAGSVYLAKRLVEKSSLGSFGASAIAILGGAVVGGVILFGGFIVAILLATIMHEWK